MHIPRVAGPIGYAVQMIFDKLITFLQRWLTLNVDAVPNLAALAALDATAITNGASKRVLTLRANFVLDKTSALVPDGITDRGRDGRRQLDPDGPRPARRGLAAAGSVVHQRRHGQRRERRLDEPHGDQDLGGIRASGGIDGPACSRYHRHHRDGSACSGPRPREGDHRIVPPDGQGRGQVLLASTVVSFTAATANQGCLLAITGFDAAGNEQMPILFPNALGAGIDAWAMGFQGSRQRRGWSFPLQRAID